MFEANIATVLIVSLLVMVALGVHIAIALGMTSALGVYLVTGGNFNIVLNMLASTAYESLRSYEFAVIPLFMLMGEFIGKSGAVTDVYRAIHRGLRRIPGRLAVATLLGNAIFSFVTGVSIASAAAFSRIAYPEMKRFDYHHGFALGAIAGSSCLGMLIPPSVLMIVWGLLTERSIGQIFLAGVLPGFLLMSLFVIYVLTMAILRPSLVGSGKDKAVQQPEFEDGDGTENTSPSQVWGSALGILLVIMAVLGGIWFGVFTPTEGAGAGAFIGLVMAIAKGMRYRGIIDAILSVGRTSAPYTSSVDRGLSLLANAGDDRRIQRYSERVSRHRNAAVDDPRRHDWHMVHTRHGHRFNFDHASDSDDLRTHRRRPRLQPNRVRHHRNYRDRSRSADSAFRVIGLYSEGGNSG